MKKAARREKLEKQQQEGHRIRELLQLQNLLDSMGAENVRSDFKSGKNGAVVGVHAVQYCMLYIMPYQNIILVTRAKTKKYISKWLIKNMFLSLFVLVAGPK